MNVRLEHISIQGKREIFGKASSVIEDTLLKYFVEERQKFVIENYLLTADEITQRLTRNLSRYVSEREARIIRIALREIVINSIEHGNLCITFDEKTAALGKGDYFALIEERRKDPRYRDRRVTIDYAINEKGVEYLIRDEGAGFDFRSLISEQEGDEEASDLSHGRGIMMTRGIFDRVKYDRNGTRVRLIKRFKES